MEYILSDIIELIGGGTPKTSVPEYWDGDIPWLSVKDFSGDKRYVYETEKCITKDGLNNSSTKYLNQNDIIVSARGTVGEMAMIPFPMTFNQSCYGIRAKRQLVDPFYLYYLLKCNLGALKSKVHGSVFDTITKDTFKQITVDVPNLEVQRKVADFLGNLDDKIENNEKINRNLAEQSQMILQSYMISKEYVLTPLSEIADIIDCLHSKKPQIDITGRKQLIQLDNITNEGFLDLESYKYMISDDDYKFWIRKCEIQEGDCVITNVGRVGAVSQAPAGTHAAMGRNMTCIRLKKRCPWYSYIITVLLSEHMKYEISKNTDVGTIMNALNVKDIPKLLFPVFAENEMLALESELKAVRGLIEVNYLENQRLSALRDTLLPKLMSGELDVSNLDI